MWNAPRRGDCETAAPSPLFRDFHPAVDRNAVRVLHIAQSVAGGIASFFEELAPHQNRVFGEENVKFLIPSGGEQHLPDIAPAQLLSTTSSARRLLPLIEFTRAALHTIEEFKPEIVHLHSSFAGALRMFLHEHPSRPKIVYCPHGWAFGMDLPGTRQRAYAAVERRLLPTTDLVIVNSQSEYAMAVQHGISSEKLRVIRNGISWMPPRTARKYPEISIAFVGRHDRQKGLDILLDAISRFPSPRIHLHVIGKAVCGRRREDEARFATPSSNVTFHGWLDRKAIVELLRKVDAVVMPSRWEAFGLVAIEAMRAGVPVIASNRGALPEVVQDGVGGYIFDLDDRDALGRLLSNLDRSALRRLGVLCAATMAG